MFSERHLWSAVLSQAIEDLTDTRTGAQALDSTRLWFASDNYEPGSFLWICDQLEFDAPTIGQRLLGIVGQRASPSEVLHPR